MNQKQLNYFVAVAKYRSFTRASQELFICQSALSKSIKELEKDLGVQLIDRAARGFLLTQEGRNLYEHAEPLLLKIQDEISGLYDCLDIEKGTIRVGVPPVIGTAIFAHIIGVFQQDHGDIVLDIAEVGANIVKQKVEQGEVDIGVIILPFSAPGFIVTPIVQAKNVLVVGKGHRFAGRKTVAFRELAEEPFYSLNETFMLHDSTIRLCEQAGFSPRFVGKSSQWDFIASMVALNRGICILPCPIMNKFNSDGISIIQLKEPEFFWNIALIVRDDRYISKALQNFIDVARAEGPKMV